jgi:hypothetical protein
MVIPPKYQVVRWRNRVAPRALKIAEAMLLKCPASYVWWGVVVGGAEVLRSSLTTSPGATTTARKFCRAIDPSKNRNSLASIM